VLDIRKKGLTFPGGNISGHFKFLYWAPWRISWHVSVGNL